MPKYTNFLGVDMRTVALSKQAAHILEAVGAEARAFIGAHRSSSSEELRQLRKELLSEIDCRGWVVVQSLRGEPEKMLLGLASLVGTVGIPVDELDAGPLVMDIKPEEPTELGMEISSRSATAFDFHTDLSYVQTPPDRITNLCIQPDINGKGRTIISDVRDCLFELSKRTVEELTAPRFTFIVPPRCRGGVLDQMPILTKNADGHFEIRVRFDKVAANSDSASAAVTQLYEALHAHRVEFLLEKDSAYIIDNRRVVHGRTDIEFRGDGRERHLKRVYGMRLRSALVARDGA